MWKSLRKSHYNTCQFNWQRLKPILMLSRRICISGDNSRFEQPSMSFLQSESPKITVWLNCTWTDWSCSTSQLSFWIRSELGAKHCQDGLPTISNHRLHRAPVFPQTIQIHSDFSEDLQSILGSSFQGKSSWRRSCDATQGQLLKGPVIQVGFD